MIVYFSACGNNRHLANRIAKETKDDAVLMTDAEEIALKDGENFGIVVPTYFWGLPTYVKNWLTNVTIKSSGNHYVYLVTSFGTTTGCIGDFTTRLLKKKGLRLCARYAVRMPDTWTVWFDLSNSEKVQKKNDKADRKLDDIIERIKEKKTNRFMPYSLPQPWGIFAQIYYEMCRKTSHLKLDQTACIGCRICEKQCPENAITMKDGKAAWCKEQCTMCLGCLHKCPKVAIQYDNKTKKHGQYLHPYV